MWSRIKFCWMAMDRPSWHSPRAGMSIHLVSYNIWTDKVRALYSYRGKPIQKYKMSRTSFEDWVFRCGVPRVEDFH